MDIPKKHLAACVYWASTFFVFSLLVLAVNVSAATYPIRPEANIFGGHVKASITYEKDRSPNYTAVGDTVTVTTTLVKLDDVSLADDFKQSSVITLFPDDTQGLALKGEPTFTYKKGALSEQGKFVDPSSKLHLNVIKVAFNTEVRIYYEDETTYEGRMTEIPISEQELDDGPYDDTYSLANILVNTGDEVILSYQATVTSAALKNKEFHLHTAEYDSSINDFDRNSFLTTKMPSVQQLSVVFDEATKNKQIEVTDADSYKTELTGSWDGDIDDLNPELTINGQNVTIPEGSFKTNNTFSIPIDLSEIGKIGTNSVHLKITDSNSQIAEDDAEITLIQSNTPPEVKLADNIADQTIGVAPVTQTFNLQGQWKDAESETASLYYRLNGQTVTLQEGIPNQRKGDWTDFSYSIPLNALRMGENTVEVYAVDAEGATSNTEKFVLDLGPGTVRFKSIAAEILFQNLSIAGQTMHSFNQRAVDITVEDTTGNSIWSLTVQQLSPFANGERELPATLSYQNGNENLPITNSEPVVLPTSKQNDTDYALVQDESHRFDLGVFPGAYAGEYQSELEWTIVKAP